jgi:phosphoribosylanthranilate isomerase
VIVKVCGVRTPEVAVAAIDAGADWIGLMLVPKSSRWVDDDAARQVVSAVGDRADLIGVFVEPTASECDEAASRYRLAGVQVHGNVNRSLMMACSVPVIPVINVQDRAAASTVDWPPDTLVMLDGMPDPGALPGGTGHRVPLEWGPMSPVTARSCSPAVSALTTSRTRSPPCARLVSTHRAVSSGVPGRRIPNWSGVSFWRRDPLRHR